MVVVKERVVGERGVGRKMRRRDEGWVRRERVVYVGEG